MKPLRLLPLALLVSGCAGLGDVRTHSEADFGRVRPGMTQEETRRLLGAPLETMPFARSATRSWDYQFQDAWGYLTLFSVIFGSEGTVVGTASSRINDGGDHGL